MTSETGPYLKAAAFCSDVIEGKDGVLSLIRVIDRLNVTAEGESPPTMPAVATRLKLVLMFVSGRARGSHNVRVTLEPPNGIAREAWTGTVFLEGEDRGANIIADMRMEFSSEGLYWFNLSLEDKEMTRVPFRVIYQRVGGGTARR